MSNRLKFETSPYLLQHVDNPVNWYPWGEEAFEQARREDKPVFLSIGYSTCHWCHVMMHESFEDEEIADLLNRYFISIKVDKEERPDIDSIYMAVCQAFTGSGGWPTSIFMTAEQKPFFAGTYFPKRTRGGLIGFYDLLTVINEKWKNDRAALLQQADDIVGHLKEHNNVRGESDEKILDSASSVFKKIYDKANGGFGRAPKFPTPHNLLFLMDYYEHSKDRLCLEMAEHTLMQMYRGGLFDHIGYGFCRYSTDNRFLVPHFEKMLYDNALLIMAYCRAYRITEKRIYLEIAEKTASFILTEMTSPEGGFFSAQDADSDGEEGKYYLFTPDEIVSILGEKDGQEFNRRFDISRAGNFEGKNIPNLLKSDSIDGTFDKFLPQIRQYRKERCRLHTDDKILTAWNSLMIAALCDLYRSSKNEAYLSAAKKADDFIQENICDGDNLFVSYREGKRGVKGFADDYAAYIFAVLALYDATFDKKYLQRAKSFCDKVLSEFKDTSKGGFYLYGKENEKLILQPKETYDGAIPSGNSIMAWNLVRLFHLTSDDRYEKEAKEQLDFLASEASYYLTGHGMFLRALLKYYVPPVKITVVPAEKFNKNEFLFSIPSDSSVILLDEPTEEYPLKNGKTTFYVCRDYSCMPPLNDINEVF